MSISLSKHTENLHAVDELLSDEKKCARVIDPENQNVQNVLDEQKKKTTEAFKVLVVGAYNSGKSSMINALAGRDFLPTGDLPETGVITELIYGEKYRVTLYPKEGSGAKVVVLEEPTAEEFKKYCSIDNSACQEGALTSNLKYERVVVECDIPLLKEGIMLIDTVGMNDPWGNDYITERYFPKADAIIYLMSCNRIYDAEDKKLLTRINEYGFRDLIIVYTHFGEIEYNYRRKPQSALEEFCEVARRHAANHTDIGDMGIHFIDSIDGLDAKTNGDEELLVRSGIAGLEKFYTRYLIENKGRIKIQVMNATMHKESSALVSTAEKAKHSSGLDIKQLQALIEKAKAELAIAEEEKKRNVALFRSKVAEVRPLVDASIKNHVFSLADSVNLDDYILQTSLPRDLLGKLTPGKAKQQAEAIAEECRAEFTRRMGEEHKQWASVELSKQLAAVVNDSVEAIGQGLGDFYARIDEIDAKLSGKENAKAVGRSIKDLVTGVAYAALTGDIAAGTISATYGSETLTKSFLAKLAAGVAFTLLSIPVTLPAFILVHIIADLFAILMGDPEKQELKIKEDTVKELRKQYNESVAATPNETVDSLRAFCDKFFDNAARNLEAKLQAELDKKREEMTLMISTSEKSMGEKQKLLADNESAIRELNTICANGDAIAKQYD